MASARSISPEEFGLKELWTLNGTYAPVRGTISLTVVGTVLNITDSSACKYGTCIGVTGGAGNHLDEYNDSSWGANGTECYWFKNNLTNTGGCGQVSCAIRVYYDTSAANAAFLYLNSSGYLSFNDHASYFNFSRQKVNDTAWHQICQTWDGVFGSNFYWDAVSVLKVPQLKTPKAAIVSKNNFLGDGNNGAVYGKGYIDEISRWNYTFSEAQILQLNSTPAVDDSGNNNVVNSSLNFTSDGGQLCGFNGSVQLLCGATLDDTPTVKFSTVGATSCMVVPQAVNVSLASSQGFSYCGTTGTTTHTCTYPSSLNSGENTLFIACNTTQGSQNNVFKFANNFTISIIRVFNCNIPSYPYLGNGKIDFICYSLVGDFSASCKALIFYQNGIIQANPKFSIIPDFGAVQSFSMQHNLLRGYFTDEGMRPDIDYSIVVDCDDGSANVQYSKTITPRQETPWIIGDTMQNVKNNWGYIILAVIGAFFIILACSLVVGWLKG